MAYAIATSETCSSLLLHIAPQYSVPVSPLSPLPDLLRTLVSKDSSSSRLCVLTASRPSRHVVRVLLRCHLFGSRCTLVSQDLSLSSSSILTKLASLRDMLSLVFSSLVFSLGHRVFSGKLAFILFKFVRPHQSSSLQDTLSAGLFLTQGDAPITHIGYGIRPEGSCQLRGVVHFKTRCQPVSF